MADSIRELVLANAKTSLENINIQDGYKTTLRTCKRFPLSPFAVGELPAAAIYSPDEDPAPAGSIQFNERYMVLLIEYWVRETTPGNMDTDLNNAIEDVIKALLADPQRSSNAIDTRLGAVRVFAADVDNGIGGVVVEFIVHYRFTDTDPTVPA